MKTSLLSASVILLSTTAFAQSPDNPNTPDGTRPAPVEIVATSQDGVPVCAPDAVRLPVDNTVILMVRNEGAGTVDFTAPDLFAAAEIGEREGGQAWTMEDGARLLRVPASGQVELPVRVMEAGTYDFACLTPGQPAERFMGTIEAVPTPGDG